MRMEKVRIQISIPKKLLEEIDTDTKETFLSRSLWFTRIALNALKRKKLNINQVIDLDI